MRSIALTRTLRGIPPLAVIASVPDPVDRAVQLSNIARSTGTLPPAYARLRAASLLEALAGRQAQELAALLGVTPGRISQLLSRARLAGVTS
jgi:DNA-directed RNA polymerase specialized sigma24 family protein